MSDHDFWIALSFWGTAVIIVAAFGFFAVRKVIRNRTPEALEERRHRRTKARAEAHHALLSILSLVAGLATVTGIGSWLTTPPANAVQQILAGIWLTCGLLGLVAVTVATGAWVIADAIREKEIWDGAQIGDIVRGSSSGRSREPPEAA